ncbi:unnamed protein product [Rotaria socialis]
MVNMKKLNGDKINIYFYIQSNCSQLLKLYPEFEDFPKLELCKSQENSIILGKVAILLSVIYDSFLPYALYGPPLLPVILMIITSLLLFGTNFLNDQGTIIVIESKSIIAGYLMIVGQCVFARYGDKLKYQYRKFIGCLRRYCRTRHHIYDNLNV